MTTDALILQLHNTIGRQACEHMAAELLKSGFPVKDLIDLCDHKNAQVAFHTAWILEQIALTEFDYFAKYFHYFVQQFPIIKNPSVKRHFAKIIAYALQQQPRTSSIAKWVKQDSETVAQVLFEWLIDPRILPGVKVWCIDVLAILSEQHDWVRDELQPTIETMMPNAGAGFKSRGRRFLQNIRKSILN